MLQNKFFDIKLKKIVLAITCIILSLFFIRPILVMAQEQEHKTVRVGWYESPYCYTDKFGRRMGLAYEYQQKIAAYTGWKYEYVEGNWPELFQKLEKGEIDILSDVSYTEERKNSILFPSLPMGEESYYIYIKSDNSSISLDNINSFNGIKIGVNKDSVQADLLSDWAAKNGVSIEMVEVEASVDALLRKLESGQIDAYVSVDTYGGSANYTPVCRIGYSEYYFGVSLGKPDILAQINAAMARIYSEDPYYNQKLYEKYIQAVKTSAFLTPEEKKWNEGHGVIRVGYRDNYMPFCNGDEKTGELTGALKDYLEGASECMLNAKLSFEAIPYPSVEDAMKAMDNGDIDCVFPVNLSIYECEENGVLLTDSLLKSEVYVLVKGDSDDVMDNNAATKAALTRGNKSFASFIMDYYPKWQVVYYDTIEECHKAVFDGAVDCMFVNSYRIGQTDRLRSKYDLSMIMTGKYIDSAFAVLQSDIELYSIMNKTVNLVGDQAVDAALSMYTYGEDRITFWEYMMDNLAVVIGVISFISIILLLLTIQKLKADKDASEKQRLIAATEFDHVTGLYNRNFFYEYAGRMFTEHPEYKYDAIVLNLDQFHTVNALNGWDFGDTILKAIGEEISLYLDESDGIACRSQADRFSIFCRSTEDYRNLFERVQKRVDEVSGNVSIRLRMGVMHWQEGIEPVQLFDNARTACNMLRGGHPSRIMVFNDEIRKKELRDQRLLSDLKRALEQHEFLVYYQPKFDIQSYPPRGCSAEALVRWKHSELGMISPGEFIPLFEKNCKIGEVDRYVWREAARQIASWRDKYGVVMPISVNLSRLDVFDPDLEQVLDQIIEENGLKRSDIDLEVTESAYTDNAEKVIDIVNNLRQKGHHIEMDDFGTGYSSLSMLSSMPIDILKLDQAFIKNMGHDEKDVRMVELILDIARGMHVPVVAEGVETGTQLEFLRERGCEMVQGYYFSMPLPADEFEEKFVSRYIPADTEEMADDSKDKPWVRTKYKDEYHDYQLQMTDEYDKLIKENEKLRLEADAGRKIAELKESVTALLTNMPAMTFSKDVVTGRYLACNQAFADYARKETPEGVVGLTDFEIFDWDTAEHFVEDDKKALTMDKPYIFFEDVPDAAGHPRRFQTTKLKFVDALGRVCLLGLCQDVTDAMRIKKEYDERLARARSQANIDALTGVKNKKAYQEAEAVLNNKIAENKNLQFVITVFDVNNLKRINDTLGHKAGDEYICGACRIICMLFKRSPVFRTGGDEFVVISQDEDYEHIEEMVDHIAEHNAEALENDGIVIACGIAKYEGESTVADVFGRADKNMYENKKRLKNGYIPF